MHGRYMHPYPDGIPMHAFILMHSRHSYRNCGAAIAGIRWDLCVHAASYPLGPKNRTTTVQHFFHSLAVFSFNSRWSLATAQAIRASNWLNNYIFIEIAVWQQLTGDIDTLIEALIASRKSETMRPKLFGAFGHHATLICCFVGTCRRCTKCSGFT